MPRFPRWLVLALALIHGGLSAVGMGAHALPGVEHACDHDESGPSLRAAGHCAVCDLATKATLPPIPTVVDPCRPGAIHSGPIDLPRSAPTPAGPSQPRAPPTST